MRNFEFAKGSVLGGDHRIPGKNNQDACYVLEGDEFIIAVVADGNGANAHSEVGAKIGAELAAWNAVPFATGSPVDWPVFQKKMLDELDGIIAKFGRRRKDVIEDYFLFTLLVAVVTPQLTEVAGIGDGFVIVNGHNIPLGPFNNMPPYLAYNFGGWRFSQDSCNFQVHASIPTTELASLLIGTDGVEKLDAASCKPFPNKPDLLVPPISALWEEDRFYTNPDNVRRHLTLVNGGARAIGPIGYLKDDSTLVTIRRRKEEVHA